MSRSDLRCNLELSVELLFNGGQDVCKQATIKNVGLGGAFISSDNTTPEDSVVKLKAQIPNYGILEANGKVLRKQEEGFALQFLNMDNVAKESLWGYISGNLYEQDDFPDNGGGLDLAQPRILPAHRAGEISSTLEVLERVTEDFNSKLADIEDGYLNGGDIKALPEELTGSMHEVFDVCRDVERVLWDNKELLREKQKEFREKTHVFFSKSNLMNHARTWPKGYPGDYKMLENVYRNMALSTGIGSLLDSYFLTRTLAVAVRGRLAKLTEILKDEIQMRDKPRVLNIACGSCREVVGVVPEIKQSGATVTCVDYDSDALEFAMSRLSYMDLRSQLTLRKYNVLRMINHKRNMEEFGPQDIIYSAGLFVYLEDDVLIRLVGTLYELLRPKGKLIITFEDSDRYETQDYHWLVDWDSLLQRTEQDCRELFHKAGIQEKHALRVVRDRTGVIMLFIVEKNEPLQVQ